MSDVELELIKRKKLRKMMQKSQPTQQPPVKEERKDPLAIVRSKLYARGEEVLSAALAQFPQAMSKIVVELAKLIEAGKLTEPISGETLFTFLRQIGLNVRLETKIVIAEHGKAKTLAEKLRE